jgi:tRNA pseudouridine13 synthase
MQLKTMPEDFIVVEIASHAPADAGEYALVEMVKRNLSTERAVAMITDSLRLQRKAIGYAGSKDARAVTRQYITIKTSDVERIRRFRGGNVSLRFIGFVQEPLSLGQLEKNRFDIVVRKIRDERITRLSKIPNYFDEQRFSAANAEIGKHLLKAEYKEACAFVIKTDPEAGQRMAEWLESRPNDAISALRMMPKNILLMYVHAYQSLLFNEVLTRYILEQDPAATIVEGPVRFAVPTKEIPGASVPIFGFGTESHPIFGSWYEEILAREGLEPRDFVVRSLPFLTVEGGERDAFFSIEDLEIGALEDDDVFPGFKKQRLTFVLPKSCYATMAVKCLYRVGRVSGEATEQES